MFIWKNKISLFIIILLVIVQGGLILFIILKKSTAIIINQSPTNNQVQNNNLPIHVSYFKNKNFYEEAYEQAKNITIKSTDFVYGGIVPHHLIVKNKIAAFFEGLKKYNYQTIIIIGPNHFSNGKKDIILSEAWWNTPYGFIEPNIDLIKKIGSLPNSGVEENPFNSEHSISSLVGFIKYSLPNVKIVPIILKSDMSLAETENLIETITKNIDKNKTLLIASVDFSHYQPAYVADFHDKKSISTIENFNFKDVGKMEIDSPPSVYVLLKYLEKIGAQKSELLFSTNSGFLTNRIDEPTTSHNIFYFTQGISQISPAANFLFFGDIMIDRHVGEQINKKGFNYLLGKLAGEEKRFFMGIDLIGANLEGAVTDNGEHYSPEMGNDFAFSPNLIENFKKYNFNFFNLANNHLIDQGQRGLSETYQNLDDLNFDYVGHSDGQIDQHSFKMMDIGDFKVGMAGLSMVYNNFDLSEAKEKIKELKELTDLIIVNVHWGTEYVHQFNKYQQEIAHELIDAGADIIIGHHPHVVQGVEIYKNKPIFYSLGNFIFDQYFSSDTQEGLSLGIDISRAKISFFLFPIKSDLSQISLMNSKEREEFFKKFVSWSEINKEYWTQIIGGNLDLSL